MPRAPRRPRASRDPRLAGAPPVIEPRLRFGPTFVRGLMYGMFATLPVGIAALLIERNTPREEFLAAVSGLSLLTAVIALPVGGLYWLCCRGDVRRWRDRHTVIGMSGAVSVITPQLVRVGGLTLMLGCATVLLYELADTW